jgi:hypothetical protein
MKFEIITNYPAPEIEKKWFAFLPDSDYPSHYTSPGFFKEPFWAGKNPFAVLVFEEEKIVGAATGLQQEKQIVCGLEVRPQVSVSTNCDRKNVIKTLVEGLLEIGKDEAELLTFHCSQRLEDFVGFGFNEKKATGTFEVMMLDLSKGADTVFKNFSQSRRSDLRKAMREKQIEISQIETEGELAELYEIHKGWSERKQIAPDTWEMMQTVFANRDYHRIFIAKHKGKVIAGSYFRFCRNGIFEYTANNSIPEYQRFRPNDLLVWKSIEWACEQGFKLYSMGGSHLFLRRFGGFPVSSYRYQLDRTFLKKHEKKEAVRELAIKTYQSLPPAARQTIKRIAGRI